jgi:hypothetical protein
VKITIESTDRIVEFAVKRGQKPYQARVWEGRTESGIPIQCLIPRIAVTNEADQTQFENELKQCREPEAEPQAFPMRMLI